MTYEGDLTKTRRSLDFRLTELEAICEDSVDDLLLCEEAEETIEQLTHGDVEGLIKSQMGEHQGMFDSFVSTVKRILIIAACILGAYLSIPIFVARKTAESCSKKHLTQPPFPTNEKL